MAVGEHFIEFHEETSDGEDFLGFNDEEAAHANRRWEGSNHLKVIRSDFHAKENSIKHFTSDYDIIENETPVMRRGFSFNLSLHFDRAVDFSQDIIELKFYFDPRRSSDEGLSFTVKATDNSCETLDETRWDAVINKKEDSMVALQVQIPVSCQVGEWSCDLVTQASENSIDVEKSKISDQFYILFNPWHKEDGVYLPNENERKEYVMTENGTIWQSSEFELAWDFGQFNEPVLPFITKMFKLSDDLKQEARGDPVLVARAISAFINSKDENGLMVGRWGRKGDGLEIYEDGTSPLDWTGSAAIIEEYSRAGCPVKYGQCWVFSALVVTVCRALGIPCRSVTNDISARDTNKSLTLDIYAGKDVMNYDNPEGDFWWAYHVWNDVWMSRPDLPEGYGGWQALDATPQEKSEKIIRCGPASVEAIRKGQVDLKYDTGFVFTEVNADVLYFVEDKKSDSGYKLDSVDQEKVGPRIVTQKVGIDGSDEEPWEDITNFYKNKEGSKEDKMSVFNAIRGNDLAKEYYKYPDKKNEDVSFDLLKLKDVQMGEPFTAIVHMKNNSEETRTIAARLNVHSVFYNGAIANKIKHEAKDNIKLEPNAHEKIRVRVEPEDYISKLADHNLIKLSAIATVDETNQTWIEEGAFRLKTPDLKIDITDDLKVGKTSRVSFSFKNPLNCTLENCRLNVEGSGCMKPKSLKHRDVEPYEKVTITEEFTPRKAGTRKIVANFSSQQLFCVTGSADVNISE